MEETLLGFAPAILAVAVAVFLRVRRSIKEASDETVALRRRVNILEQRTRELESAQRQAEERARNVRLREAAPVRLMMRPAAAPPIPPVHHSEPEELTESQKEVAEVLNQLHVMKAQLSLDPVVEEKYITELNGIVDRLERATGCDLSRWLGTPRRIVKPARHLTARKPTCPKREYSVTAICSEYKSYRSRPFAIIRLIILNCRKASSQPHLKLLAGFIRAQLPFQSRPISGHLGIGRNVDDNPNLPGPTNSSRGFKQLFHLGLGQPSIGSRSSFCHLRRSHASFQIAQTQSCFVAAPS